MWDVATDTGAKYPRARNEAIVTHLAYRLRHASLQTTLRKYDHFRAT